MNRKNYTFKLSKLVGMFVIIVVVGVTPVLSFSAGLVPDCGGGPCSFNKLNELYENVSEFLLRYILAPLSVIAIAFIGIQYLTALGNSSKLEKVHESAKDVLWGIVIALAAYGIIAAIFKILTVGESIPTITN